MMNINYFHLTTQTYTHIIQVDKIQELEERSKYFTYIKDEQNQETYFYMRTIKKKILNVNSVKRSLDIN
jgi:hypothetical protein